ncbi:hypothetical protein, partial [Nocardioides sp. NPDC000441]|uniref:hypothetical protein n=1 Tax=Nocardioides sp. NPDC000441 TaxID=3154256 RepID=UPI0033168403
MSPRHGFEIEDGADAGVGEHAAAMDDDAGGLRSGDDVVERYVGNENEIGPAAGSRARVRQPEHGAGARRDRGEGLGRPATRRPTSPARRSTSTVAPPSP